MARRFPSPSSAATRTGAPCTPSCSAARGGARPAPRPRAASPGSQRPLPPPPTASPPARPTAHSGTPYALWGVIKESLEPVYDQRETCFPKSKTCLSPSGRLIAWRGGVRRGGTRGWRCRSSRGGGTSARPALPRNSTPLSRSAPLRSCCTVRTSIRAGQVYFRQG
jgi:hypothetical protein